MAIAPLELPGGAAAGEEGRFPGTAMPDGRWWHTLWPDPDLTLRRLGVRPGRLAVDLCCGDGWFTPALARMADETVGVDLDRPLLAMAAARAQREAVPGCRFVAGDALDVSPKLGGRADLVLLANTLHGASDRAALLRAIAANLTARGRIFVVNWHHWPREGTIVLGQPRGPCFDLRMTPCELHHAAASAGLETERLVELPPYHYALVLRPRQDGTAREVEALLASSTAAGPDIWQERLIAFWAEAGLDGWFAKDPVFDDSFRNDFLPLHQAAARRDLDGWAGTARGALALLILLDQFPRNVFRDTAHMLATDALALRLAHGFLRLGFDQRLPPDLRLFFYLPFTHSEDLVDQELSLRLRRKLGPALERHAAVHVDIIRRFGRFPHRNALLGRETTADEASFLSAGGFSG
ncbi:DUF924 family protein [Lichenicoccus roseus]|nr:DUF924 family protein [Lichenicoccus roseus]